MQVTSEHLCFGGRQGFYHHESHETGLPMRFAVYQPPQALTGSQRVPALLFLAGLTATEETFAIKAGAQRLAADLGLMLIMPDVSPRNTGIAGADDHWDLGHGAGFYLDATQPPWSKHFRMESWLLKELLPLVCERFPVAEGHLGITGHSMGGHGALTLALRHPGFFRSVSALAPIAAPTHCPWGHKAFGAYLGESRAAWEQHDASALMQASHAPFPNGLLIDQGEADKFLLEGQLLPEHFEAACEIAQQPLTLRRHAGYDHGWYFVASFIGDHLRFHAERLATS